MCHGAVNHPTLSAFAGRKVALIQRSCGYSLRPTLSIDDIRAAVRVIKQADPRCVVAVDNCYGEFTEPMEPGEVRICATEVKC